MRDRPWFSVGWWMAELQRLRGERPWWQAWLIDGARIHLAVIRDLVGGQLTLRAMSLVYTTLLSLVPLLAISFSVLKGFGYHHQIEPMLTRLMGDLGAGGAELIDKITEFVDNVEVGVLGFLGIALLFYTMVSTMRKIERAFNFIWHVTRERGLIQRFRDYLGVLVVSPVLMFSSLGITASFMNDAVVREVTSLAPIGALIDAGATLIPYLLISAAFSFIYAFIPYTRVQARAALIGGLIAGLLWHLLGWGFASFVAASPKYTVIYSTFATLILFLIWIYLGWLILLIGGSISFYIQHPDYIAMPRGRLRLSARYREKLALAVAHAIAQAFHHDGGSRGVDDLAGRLEAPSEAVEGVLDALEAEGFVVRDDGEPPGYLPGRPPESIMIKQILDAVRATDEQPHADPAELPREPAIDAVLETLDRASEAALEGRTLEDLALPDPPSALPAARAR